MRIKMFPISKDLPIRGILLCAILVSELVAITGWFQVPSLATPLLGNHITSSAWLFRFSKELWPMGLWVAACCFIFLIPKSNILLIDLRELACEYRWSVWLVFHMFAFSGFLVLTSFIFERPTDTARLSASCFGMWFVLGSVTLTLWLLAIAPIRFWRNMLRQHYLAFFLGTLFGLGAWVTIEMLSRQQAPLAQIGLWAHLARPTLQLAHSLLTWVYSDLFYQPDRFLLGAGSFRVRISYACSGIEGVSLICIFLGIYIWVFRKNLRFPQVFWLFPLGVAVIWLANVLRIVLLIIIGSSLSPEVALRGFHAQAGWIAFTLISVGTIALSNHMHFFSITKPNSMGDRTRKPLAAALLVPLIVLLSASMVTTAISSGFDMLYPFRVVAVIAALWYFRHAYSDLGWKWNWRAVAIGTAVFVIWMLLEPRQDSSRTSLAQGLAELPSWLAAFWLAFRALGSVIVVPLVEEFAFRGYLMRKMIGNDYENVPLGHFSWFSFTLTSVLFGLMHERWIAATLAGMGYGLAVCSRRQIGDAVVAHVTTNALIAIIALTQARWSLWC